MLSFARSRYTHFFRLALTATNIVGVLFGASYNYKTLDLYPGSAHSAVGWIATGIAAAQISHLLVGPMTKLFNRVAGRDESESDGYTLPLMRQSYDSLQGLDGPSGLSRQGPFDVEATHGGTEDCDTPSYSQLYREDPNDSGFTSGDGPFDGESNSDQALHDDINTAPPKIFSDSSLTRTLRLILFMYDIMDWMILIVAFIAFCTGTVTFWGLFVSHDAPRTIHAQEENLTPAP